MCLIYNRTFDSFYKRVWHNLIFSTGCHFDIDIKIFSYFMNLELGLYMLFIVKQK